MTSKLAFFAIVNAASLILASHGIAQEAGGIQVPERPSEYNLPPSTGGGGGRPPAMAEPGDDVPEGFGETYYDPPDYIEDCAHPWHGECGPSPTWPKPFTAEELRRIEQHAAAQATGQGFGEGSAATDAYDTPSFDGFRADLGSLPRDDTDW